MAGTEYWESRYKAGHRQRYPWDSVVSFLFRAGRLGVPHCDIAVLEVGFGTGANLWCAAREGFHVAGIEASPAAVDAARKWFAEEGLAGDLRQGSFTSLPFDDASFDLIIDRAALTCAPLRDIAAALGEIARVAKPDARFLLNCYADSHSSARSGTPAGDATRENITQGSLAGLDRITFLAPRDVRDLLQKDWEIESLKRIEIIETATPEADIHAELLAVARRR